MRRNILWAIGLIFIFNITLHGQQVGNEGPDFEVNLLGGDQFKLSDQQGKVVLVYLFGNSCPFCIASGPAVESTLFKAFNANPNFTAVGLDTWNSSSNTASVTSFKSKTGITFPLAIKAGFVATDYQTTYDRLLVIDHNGILVHKGLVPAGNDINNALQAIETSLASIPTDPCETAEINITYVDSPPSCPGESDGSIDITVTGSYPAFSYSWSNGFNTEDIMGLSEGSFNVTVTDSEECTASLEIILDEPPIMSITEKVYNPSCAIDSFGSIKIDVSGGAGPYQILWPNESTNDSISGLTEGCYSVEVTDANECFISKTICITIPEPLIVEHTITDIACNGDNSGSIFVQVNGGTPP